MELKINVTEEQLKAVNAVVMDAQDWLQKAWDGKANSCMKRILIKHSDKNVTKLNDVQKVEEFNKLTLKTRKQLEAEGENKLNI